MVSVDRARELAGIKVNDNLTSKSNDVIKSELLEEKEKLNKLKKNFENMRN